MASPPKKARKYNRLAKQDCVFSKWFVKRTYFYLWSAATLLCMAAIFAFSAFNADESSEMSGAVTKQLFGGKIDMEALVRKGAHVAAYAGLGFCAANSLKYYLTGRKLFLTSLAFTSFYGATDEFHQLFVPGRSAEVRDWAIDTAGALIGTGAAMLWIRLISPSRRKDC